MKLKHADKLNNIVNSVIVFFSLVFQLLIFKNIIDNDNDTISYEADTNALNNIPVGRTLAEARALGPMVTPRQYQCSFCGIGLCGVQVTTIQCYCGNNQCQQATTQPSMNTYSFLYLFKGFFYF
jgi:hypothetical protein